VAPKYQEIADRLRDQIGSGALAPGDRLPSEPELIAEHQASRNTVRLAIALLTNQGLVVTRQGLGTFVLEPAKPFTALLSRVDMPPTNQYESTAMPVVGPAESEPQTVRFLVDSAPASASVAEKLEIAAGDPVIIRRSQQYLDDAPWMIINSYFPMDIASGTALEQAGKVEQGTNRLLADLGHEQVGFTDEIGARMPDTPEFDYFQPPTGTPVIVVNRTSYSSERPIRLTRYIYRGDRVRLVHEQGRIPEKYRTA